MVRTQDSINTEIRIIIYTIEYSFFSFLGGRLPPDPLFTKLGKIILPCLYRERVHIKLGADMENRHRDVEKKKGVPQKK